MAVFRTRKFGMCDGANCRKTLQNQRVGFAPVGYWVVWKRQRISGMSAGRAGREIIGNHRVGFGQSEYRMTWIRQGVNAMVDFLFKYWRLEVQLRWPKSPH